MDKNKTKNKKRKKKVKKRKNSNFKRNIFGIVLLLICIFTVYYGVNQYNKTKYPNNNMTSSTIIQNTFLENTPKLLNNTSQNNTLLVEIGYQSLVKSFMQKSRDYLSGKLSIEAYKNYLNTIERQFVVYNNDFGSFNDNSALQVSNNILNKIKPMFNGVLTKAEISESLGFTQETLNGLNIPMSNDAEINWSQSCYNKYYSM